MTLVLLYSHMTINDVICYKRHMTINDASIIHISYITINERYQRHMTINDASSYSVI